MPDPSLLEVFETPADRPIVIEHVAEEFTSVCPMTGHPDFGEVVLRYQPRLPDKQGAGGSGGGGGGGGSGGGGGCVELKSLKLYYHSFRNEGIFYEGVTHRVRDDLAKRLDPVWMQVITRWRGRGGIRSVVRAEFGDVPAEWRGR